MEAEGATWVKGYYRYTDIQFEWHTVLSPEDANALKATLHPDALTHPDNPLYDKEHQGTILYYGQLHDSETRLVFSSRQIEYLRYWLHAMGLTAQPIPLPSSSCLIPTGTLPTVSHHVFQSGYELKRASRIVEKFNRRVKYLMPKLRERRERFEVARAAWFTHKGTWIAIDFEGWDGHSDTLLEFGWSSESWVEPPSHGHLIIAEHRGFHNGQYTPDNRDNYNYGQSEDVDKTTFGHRLRELVEHGRKDGPLFIVVHGGSWDVKNLVRPWIAALQQEDVDQSALPVGGRPIEDRVYVVDTADLFAALEGLEKIEHSKLERLCMLLGVHVTHLHNAGNDAYATMAVLRAMLDGAPLDAQREERWPGRTPETLAAGGMEPFRARFKPSDEDSGASDGEAGEAGLVDWDPLMGGPFEGINLDGPEPPAPAPVEYVQNRRGDVVPAPKESKAP